MAAEDHICDKCPICLKTFCDPRMLPCLHSFCCQCLDHEVEKVGTQHNIQCPTCLSSVPIPMGGASRLPQNLHLEFEVEIARYMSKIVSNKGEPCTFCVNGCTDPAEMFCCTCCKFLCKGAQNCHERAPQLAYHNIIGLNKESSSELFPTVLRRSEIYCTQPKHETKELDLYCNTCSSLTCNKCVLEYHKDHNITPLSLIAEAHRDEMKEALQSAHEVMSNLAGAIEANKKMMQRVETSKQEAALAIEHAFGQLMETLVERKKALLADLEAISLSKVTALNLQKEQFEQIQQSIGHHPEMISQILLTHANHEVVALGGQVPSKLEHTLKQAKTVSLTPQSQSYLKFSLQANPVEEELSQVGNIVDLSPTPGASNCVFAPVSKVNAEYIVKVETFSSNGEKYPCGGLQVKAELRPKSHDGPVVPGEVEDHGDGTYTISLTPQTAGPHQLHVTMDGKHVQKSPYDMRVIDYNTLCNPEVIRVSSEPYSVAIDDKGQIYVAGEYSIDVFDQDGNLKKTIGDQGSANGEFSGPIGIFIKKNEIYCADCGNNRIQTLTTQGKFLGKFGKKGSGPGLFNGPWNVVVDSKGRLIVSDSDNHRVQVFNQDGDRLLLTIDGNGFNDQSFKDPRGLAIDPDLYIHVVAHGSNTVKVFTPEGTYVRMYGDLEGPIGIAIDEQGYCFVSEERGNCISIFDPYGHMVHKVENLNNPFGIALDFNGGVVYVSNFGSREVLKYTL